MKKVPRDLWTVSVEFAREAEGVRVNIQQDNWDFQGMQKHDVHSTHHDNM